MSWEVTLLYFFSGETLYDFYKDTSGVAKKAAEVAQKKRATTGPWWVLSIMEVR